MPSSLMESEKASLRRRLEFGLERACALNLVSIPMHYYLKLPNKLLRNLMAWKTNKHLLSCIVSVKQGFGWVRLSQLILVQGL